MQVILNQDIKGQGKKGDLVNVSDGYARNFLFPKNLAKPATKENINVMKGQLESREYRLKTELEQANALAKQISQIKVKISAKAGENGKLFGSITSKDVSDALIEQHHIKIDKKKFNMSDGIKTLGTTNVEIKVYPNVTATLAVEVAAVK